MFNWVSYPPENGCSNCLSIVNDRGFVQTYASVNVKNDVGSLIGEIDVIFCASCVLEMSKLVGAAMPAETEAFAQREYDLLTENEKLKDEIQGWQQRFLGLANLDVEDFEKLAKLERASKMVIVENGETPPVEK